MICQPFEKIRWYMVQNKIKDPVIYSQWNNRLYVMVVFIVIMYLSSVFMMHMWVG